VSGAELKQRLAAILAADVAGYSRLMAADERATVAALDSARAVFRTQIESIGGRVIDMAGDSVLAVFVTATGAVSAALAIQQQLRSLAADVPDDRRMGFRIGVHLGDVIEKADGTVYGDGVNIAARLEGLAEPGGITVSESIRTAVKGKVGADFGGQGAQQVKNIADPVRAYRVKIEADAASKPTPAVGVIDLSLPDKPSIAVLPFTNKSGDPATIGVRS
jgi:adenylate cyclase